MRGGGAEARFGRHRRTGHGGQARYIPEVESVESVESVDSVLSKISSARILFKNGDVGSPTPTMSCTDR